MIGDISVEELKNSENKEWFSKYYSSYEPDNEKVQAFKKELPSENFKFEIFLGTWCPDSHREIPHMVKLFDKIGVKADSYQLIGVNQFKDLPAKYEDRKEELQLNRVPTLIFYKDGKEVNRYVERAQNSLLDDLLAIVKETGYKNTYYAD